MAPYAPASGWDIGEYRGLERTSEPAVLVLTPDEAGAALAATTDRSLCVVLWAGEKQIARALLDDPRVAGALDPACSPAHAYAIIAAAVTRAQAVVHMSRTLEIGQALAAERDLDTLLGLILTHARLSTGADGASIYTRDKDGAIYFRLWQNASMAATPTVEKTSVGEDSIAGHVARTGKPLLVADAHAVPADAPYTFNAAFDRETGYQTKSLLTLALTNKAGETVGVLQLVNRKDRADRLLRTPEDYRQHVRPFDDGDVAIARALAGPAGIALENSLLYADIERLFEGFIRASVQAIEARDPATAGHSFRVADFTERLALAVDRADTPDLRDVTFTREQLRELRYAALLHDFGKVGVRENVLTKAKKLHPHRLEIVKGRFRYARAAIESRALRERLALHEARLTEAERALRRREIEDRLADDLARLKRHFDTVLHAVEPTARHQRVSQALDAVVGFTFPGEAGEETPLLDDFEFADLSLPLGSLNAEERVEIESHVSHTYAFLRLIPWPRDLAGLPDIAYAHHEKLDGTGYPRHLAGAAIPVPSRIMTISDIYDALTAADRPYKRSLPAEQALDILAAEAEAGKVDAVLFRVFVDSGTWRASRGGQ
ncbi:MAG: HD domain-containing phosphohydrolase [Pseudomonadota bacterium]